MALEFALTSLIGYGLIPAIDVVVASEGKRRSPVESDRRKLNINAPTDTRVLATAA